MTRRERFAIKRVFDILYRFYKVAFRDTIIDTCFMSSLLPCAPFSVLHFDVSKMSLTSQINIRKLSVLRTGHGRNAYGLQSFLSLIVSISVE